MRSTAMPRLRSDRIRPNTLTTPLVFLLAILIFWLLSPGHRFLDPRNLAAMAKLTPDLGVVALGVGILMICGDFDLSVAAVLPLTSYVFAQLLIAGVNPFLAF